MERVGDVADPDVLEFRYHAKNKRPTRHLAVLVALFLFLWWSDINYSQITCQSPTAPATGSAAASDSEREPSALISNLAEGVCTVEHPTLPSKAVSWLVRLFRAPSNLRFSFLNWKDAVAVPTPPVSGWHSIDVLGFQIPLPFPKHSLGSWNRYEPRWCVMLSYTDADHDTRLKTVLFHDFGTGSAAERSAKAVTQQMKEFLFNVETRKNSAEWQEWRNVMLERVRKRQVMEARAARFGWLGHGVMWFLSLFMGEDPRTSKYLREQPHVSRSQEPLLYLHVGVNGSWHEEGGMIVVGFFIWLLVKFGQHRETLKLDKDEKTGVWTDWNVLNGVVQTVTFDLEHVKDVKEIAVEHYRVNPQTKAVEKYFMYQIQLRIRSIENLFDFSAHSTAEDDADGFSDDDSGSDSDSDVKTEEEKEPKRRRRLQTLLLLCGDQLPDSARAQVTATVELIDRFVRDYKRERKEKGKVALQMFKRDAEKAKAEESLLGFSVADHIKELQREVAQQMSKSTSAKGMTPRVKAGSHKKNSKEAARRWKDIAKNIKVLTAHCRLDQELAAL